MSTETKNLGLTKAAGTEKYSLDVVNGNLDKVDEAIGELRESLGENSPIVTALEAIKTSIESDTSSAEIAEVKTLIDGNADKIDTVKQNTETLKTTANGISAKVETIDSNISGNGTKLDTLADKSDDISDQVQTVGNNVNAVKTDIASVKSSVDTANTNISSIKTTVESTSEKADTAVELLNLLKAIATTKTKPLICCKGVKENADWQTVVSISGSGVLEKAFARSATSDGLVRITIDDEVVLVTKAAYQDVVGAIKDDLWSSQNPQSVIITSDGGFMWYSINQNGGWYVGFPGSAERDKGCMCVIPGGIRFEKNFKFEVKAITAGVIITGEVSENSVVTTL